jgi:hypothetical protein
LLYTQDQLKEEGIFDVEGIVELKPDIATEYRCYENSLLLSRC